MHAQAIDEEIARLKLSCVDAEKLSYAQRQDLLDQIEFLTLELGELREFGESSASDALASIDEQDKDLTSQAQIQTQLPPQSNQTKTIADKAATDSALEFRELSLQVESFRGRLEVADDQFFSALRQVLLTTFQQSKEHRVDLLQFAQQYLAADLSAQSQNSASGTQASFFFDELDHFYNQLLQAIPQSVSEHELNPELVRFQKTPLRSIVRFVELSGLSQADCLVDVGSGYGQLLIVAQLLSGAKCCGIEIDPVLHDFAVENAKQLGLTDISYIMQDAREADYSQGTHFYFYTPFRAEILDSVLNRIREHSGGRSICIISTGDIGSQIASQAWLQCIHEAEDTAESLMIFRST